MVTNENRVECPKNYKDLWNEGDYFDVVGKVFLSASAYLPISLTAVILGVGMLLIAVTSVKEKWNQLLKDNPEMFLLDKLGNSVLMEAIESVSKRLGALFDISLLKKWYKGISVNKVKGVLTDMVLYILKEAEVEGIKEVVSTSVKA
jgi:phosphoribosylformylglycinamidine (FGAM) synthase-like enzyme